MTDQERALREFRKQKKQHNNSAEIFTAFTMSRIDPEVLATMTPEQVEAVKQALLAESSNQKHAIDVRFSVPLYFARYYVLVLAGRDKRHSTKLKETLRRQAGDKPAAITFAGLAMAMLMVVFGLSAFFLAYWIKTEIGIDIFPDKHLHDIIFDIFN